MTNDCTIPNKIGSMLGISPQSTCIICATKASAKKAEKREKFSMGTPIAEGRGKAFACCTNVQKKLGLTLYFADAYCSWQRGSNENSKGLLREFYPKKE